MSAGSVPEPPPAHLAEQLGGAISTDRLRQEIVHLDRDADAVSRLFVRGLIGRGVANRARDKIARSVWRALQRG